MSKSAEEEHYSCNDDNDVESPSFLFGNEDSAPYSSRSSIYSDDFSDDDSNNSARIVEATIKNAVEKTVSSFPTLLKGFFEETERLDDSIFLFVDLPMGFSISKLNMFYDQMITSLVPSLVITNKAGTCQTKREKKSKLNRTLLLHKMINPNSFVLHKFAH
jgi:hypothetical protein